MKRIDSTKKIPVGSLLRVYKKGFGYGKITVIDANEYYLGALADSDFFNTVTEDDRIQAYLWVEDVASYEFDLEIIGRIDSRHKILFFKNTEHLLKSNERKCLTADVDLPIKFFVFDTGTKGKSFSSEKIDFHYGTLVKLADRSGLIKCNDELSDDVFYKGHVLINGEDIELMGKVKLIKDNHDKFYDISFTGMHESFRNKLLDYIFSIYRE